MLKLIENKFLNSQIKVKIQLYILPLFIIYFYFYFINNTNDTNLNSSNKTKNLNSLINKKFEGSYLKLIKDIEAYCYLEKIKISSINYNKSNLFIKGKTSLKKVDKLILKLENINNFSNINSLSIEKLAKKNLFTFEIKSEFKKYYIKEKVKLSKKNKKRVEKFKLKAIISNNVLLNNKWYALNDEIGKYKILKIEKNIVVLNYKEKNIKLRLLKNE